MTLNNHASLHPQARPARFLPKGIRARLFMLISLTLLPLLGLLGWSYYQRYQTQRSQALANELEVAHGVATTFQVYVSEIRLQNHAIGQAISTFATYTKEKATRILTVAAQQSPSIRNVSWVSPEGLVLASSEPDMVGRDLSYRPYFQQVLAGAPWATSDLMPQGILNKRPTMSIATRIHDDHGVLRGVVVTGIEPTRLGEVTLTQQRPAGGAYAIFDRQGTLVYRNPESPLTWEDRLEWKASDQVLRRVLETGKPLTGITRLKIWKGDWISARAPIGDLGWVAGAGRPVEFALAPVRHDLYQDLLWALVVAAGAFGLAFLFSQTIARPLRELERDSWSLGAGQHQVQEFDPQAPAEVLGLRATVATMAARLIERAEALRQSESTLRSFYESAAMLMGIVELTDENEIVHLHDNPATARFFGIPPEDTTGKSAKDLGVPAHAVQQWITHYRESQKLGRPVGFEYLHQTAQGPLWLSAHVAPIGPGPSGRMRFSYVAEDITLRKQAEKALRQSEQRYRDLAKTLEAERGKLEAIVQSMTEGLVIFDPAGNLLDMNPAALALHGFDDVQTLRRHLAQLPQFFELRDLEGNILPIDEWPIARALRGETFTRYEARVLRTDGSKQWVASYGGAPVLDAQGRMLLAVVTLRDITDLREAEQRLRETNERLAEADRRKDEFLAMLAHELRNPLAPIRYAVQMLALVGPDEQRLARQRQVIDRQVSHMGRLLDDLLDVSRITRGKIQLKREIVDLRDVAGHAVDSLRSLFEGRGQVIQYERPSSPLLVHGDPTRLEQVIRNLLHNANKYTDVNGCVLVRVGLQTRGAHDWNAEVHVLDSGIGIDPDILPHVFEAFVQAERSLARTQGGLGIGLAMVKNLIQMHGGSVEAHSDGVGRGSEFIIRLPLAEVPREVLAEVHTTAPQTVAPPPHTCRVLVVDDNEDAAASLTELLGLWGHEVHTAYDGAHAVEAAREWRPEVVLLDIGLPGMDGYEVAGRLRQEPVTKEAYIVALTGYGGEEDRRRAQEAGFDQHLTKPVDLERLQAVLKRSCAA